MCVCENFWKVRPGAQVLSLCYRPFPERLASSAFSNEEDIKSMLGDFERSAKPVFKDEKESSCIKFGGLRDNDSAVGIRRGQLTVSG